MGKRTWLKKGCFIGPENQRFQLKKGWFLSPQIRDFFIFHFYLFSFLFILIFLLSFYLLLLLLSFFFFFFLGGGGGLQCGLSIVWGCRLLQGCRTCTDIQDMPPDGTNPLREQTQIILEFTNNPANWCSRSFAVCFTCARNVVFHQKINLCVDVERMVCFRVFDFICVSFKITI